MTQATEKVRVTRKGDVFVNGKRFRIKKATQAVEFITEGKVCHQITDVGRRSLYNLTEEDAQALREAGASIIQPEVGGRTVPLYLAYVGYRFESDIPYILPWGEGVGDQSYA